MHALNDFWEGADVIHCYTREDALADGFLVDVTTMAAEAGFTFPVAVTAAVWAIVETPEELKGIEDDAGRLWDLLWMFKVAIKKAAPGDDLIHFKALFTNPAKKKNLHTFKALCHPGDDLEPVITIMLPHED